jgi:hypothetical protein
LKPQLDAAAARTAQPAPDHEEDEPAALSLPSSEPLPAPEPSLKPRGPISGWWWVAGGVAAAGIATGVIVGVMDPPAKSRALHD